MLLEELTAISPIDGRYRQKVAALADFFSEFGLIRYRVAVEVKYFIALCRLPLPPLAELGRDAGRLEAMREWYLNFSLDDARQIKLSEQTTNHDVKAVEYFVKQKLAQNNLGQYAEFVHFGLTSQDINNSAIPLLMADFLKKNFYILLNSLHTAITERAATWRDVPMLSRTHGQPASPTLLGKELLVFAERLHVQQQGLIQLPISAKFGGAVGNFNAHYAAYPNIDWQEFANRFLADALGLSRQQYTTQIEHYDGLAALFDAVKRINTILIDFCRDIWAYISMDYFKQQIVAGEVGSSTMPHKVNPVDFENAEGNLGVANALFEHLAAKLPVSRLQRDLTDSTVLRNIGVPFAHSVLAIHSLLKGLSKLLLNQTAIHADLSAHWEVVTEGIQTILRREGYPQPYEALKALSRNNDRLTPKNLADFIHSLATNDAVKAELLALTPFNYTGNPYP